MVDLLALFLVPGDMGTHFIFGLTEVLFSSYIPAVVDHRGGMPCHGTFLLHQVFSVSSLEPTDPSLVLL